MFKKILVPLDGSDLAAKILPQVEDLAKNMQAEITLMSVGSNIIFSGIESEFVPLGYEDIFLEMKNKAEKYLTKICNLLKDKGIKTDWIYKEGRNSAREIIAYAEAEAFDLIAMATHGKGEVAWLLGSVAEKVVTHATVPVLLMRVLPVKKTV